MTASASRRRVLHIVDALDHPDARQPLAQLLAGLAELGYEPHLLLLSRTRNPVAASPVPAALLEVIDRRWTIDPLAFTRLKRHIARLHPALVQTWLAEANTYGPLAAERAGVRNIIAVGRRFKDVAPPALLERRLARPTRLVVGSPALAELQAQRGIPRGRLMVIPDGVAPLPPGAPSRSEVLAELGLPPQSRLVGAIGPLQRGQRYKDLVWATDILKIVCDDVHLLIIGEGPYRRRLERYIGSVRMADWVHLLGGDEALKQLLPHFDVFWHAGAEEPLPHVLLEAMAAAVPVVAADVPGRREAVVPGQTGLLVPLGDRAGFARVTRQLFDDPRRARQLADAGREHVLDCFSLPAMLERYARLYCELLEGTSA